MDVEANTRDYSKLIVTERRKRRGEESHFTPDFDLKTVRLQALLK
jgi:hypothetical protein